MGVELTVETLCVPMDNAQYNTRTSLITVKVEVKVNLSLCLNKYQAMKTSPVLN